MPCGCGSTDQATSTTTGREVTHFHRTINAQSAAPTTEVIIPLGYTTLAYSADVAELAGATIDLEWSVCGCNWISVPATSAIDATTPGRVVPVHGYPRVRFITTTTDPAASSTLELGYTVTL